MQFLRMSFFFVWESECKSGSSKLTARVSSFNIIHSFILIQVDTAMPVT
jgi:hypothetical protein